MDLYGVSGGNRAQDEFFRLHKSLDFCGQECKNIKRKLKKPNVPNGKKEKLVYRLDVLKNRVIPELTERMRRFSELM